MNPPPTFMKTPIPENDRQLSGLLTSGNRNRPCHRAFKSGFGKAIDRAEASKPQSVFAGGCSLD